MRESCSIIWGLNNGWTKLSRHVMMEALSCGLHIVFAQGRKVLGVHNGHANLGSVVIEFVDIHVSGYLHST